ncbi:MAG: hypothetical protein ACI9OJ_001200 [Myxococcota bacterium]
MFAVDGLSPWESFYTVPQFGDPAAGGPHAGTQWWSFQERGQPNVPEFFRQRCGNNDVPMHEPFANDAAGVQVRLGPFALAFRRRPDLMKRMRIWVMHHELQPHDAAIPYAVTGSRLGVPGLASLGTHVQRFYQDRADGVRSAPHAYSIIHSSLKGNRGDSAWATGLHRASARPLVVRLGPGSRVAERLTRSNVAAYRRELDDLVRHYTQRLSKRTSPTLDALGRGLRNPALDDFDFARYVLENHQDLAEILRPDLLVSELNGHCGEAPASDETSTSIRLAAHLLTTQTNRARYVQVMDGGLYPDPAGMGYDSHPEHVVSQGANISHTLEQLAANINEPGENDPQKLDLDKHFVWLNTEFGRTPYPEVTKTNPDGLGSNHWPWGYVVVGLGGFIDEDRAGIVGAIGEDGHAIGGFTPAEHRCAMLQSMGIWPFVSEGFAVADVGGVEDELDAAVRLREELLGYPV